MISILLASFFILWVYLYTLAPTVALHDTGELISCSYTLGITHPTGYPLFCLNNKILSSVLCIGNIAWRINFINAIFCSLCVGILGYLLHRQLKLGHISTSILSIFLGITPEIWLNATIGEKYAFAFLFASLLFLLLISGLTNKFHLKLIFFITGLSFCHHMQTCYFILPILITLYLKRSWDIKELLGGIILFFIPLLLYLYLMLREGSVELLNWGSPSNLESLLKHITGEQYYFLVYFPSSLTDWAHKLSQLFTIFFHNLSFIPIFAFIGLFFIKRNELVVILALLFSNLIFAIRYNIVNIADYYLLAFFISFYLAAAGINRLSSLFLGHKLIQRLVKLGIFLFIAITFLFLKNEAKFSSLNKRYYFFAEDYGVNLTRKLQKKAIIFTEGDNFSFPLYYLQYIENYRRDVHPIDLATLYYPWYSPFRVPYLKDTKDPGAIIKQRLIWLISKYINSYPLYGLNLYKSIPDLDLRRISQISLIPSGLLWHWRYNFSKEVEIPLFYDFILRGINRYSYLNDFRTQELLENYAAAFYILGDYYLNKGKLELAERLFREGLRIEPFCRNEKAFHKKELLKENHILAHRKIAFIYEKLGKFAEAKFHYDLIEPRDTS
jgi:hypothetical protein